MSRTTIPVITPIIHLNGNRKETLIANLEEAYRALRTAQDALRECAPNGRNYYPEPGRLAQAEAQYRTRQEHLQAVCDSLLVEVEKIEEEYPTRR
jgi:hypothetical protein